MNKKTEAVNFPTTECSLFIIEALPDEDKTAGRLDGEVLKQQLNLTTKKPQYHFVRNKEEWLLHVFCGVPPPQGDEQLG